MYKLYDLEIISAHPDFKNKPLRKYGVDGVETVGAWGDEPFEIKFHNHSADKVQVKVSVDGTDVLSGDPASTEVSSQMWLVYARRTLTLKAWPESNNGGAQFVFTHADKSVALHTHGDMSSKGIIAVAVFEEGDPEPVRVEHHHHHHNYPSWGRRHGSFGLRSKSIYPPDSREDTKCSMNINESDSLSESYDDSSAFNSTAAVGAGSFVNQNISYAKGLRQPKLADTVKVRYVWWDDLKDTLIKTGYTKNDPTGFPGDSPEKRIDLGATPRVKLTKGIFKRSEQTEWSRF